MTPLIIEAAINGGRGKHPNPAVPVGTREIVEDACACIEAGAAIVHHHTGDSVLVGRHDAAPYRDAWRGIRSRHASAILYPTMGSGGPHTNIEERYAHVMQLADEGSLEMGIIDPGSVNLAPCDDAGVPLAVDFIYQNSFADIRRMSAFCLENELVVQVSIFEPGFLATMLAWWRAGRFPTPKVQIYFCGPELRFGLPPTRTALDAYLEMLDGTGLVWMAGVLGGDCAATIAREAIRRGGHVRVGLEDYFGERLPSNAELVREVVRIAEDEGRAVATVEQARSILGIAPRR